MTRLLRHRRIRFGCALAALVTPVTVRAQTPQAQPLRPAVIIAELLPVGIDAERLARARTALEAARLSWAESLGATSGMPQDAARPLPPNLAYALRGYRIRSEPAPSLGARAANASLIVPVWCSIYDADLLALVRIEQGTGQLIAAPHRMIPRSQWDAQARLPNSREIIARLLAELGTDLATAGAAPQRGQASALHVGLALAQETTRRDQGSSLCLNLLLAARLAPRFATVSPLGQELVTMVERALSRSTPPTQHMAERAPSPDRPLRPTRTLVMEWRKGTARSLTGATALTADLRVNESVYGQSLPKPAQAVSFAVAQNQGLAQSSFVTLDVSLAEPVNALLAQEQAALNLSEPPQIAAVDRAWAYVDKGRAWGLAMDDRLVVQSNDGPVEGHVVGYFGPEKGLKSPRGFPIHEGAIVFVRKNQAASKVGSAFSFDPKTYPQNQTP